MPDYRTILDLQSHPEGGAFAEVFRSGHVVRRVTDGGDRQALTHIYFHLTAEEVSRFHRVASDEVWSLYDGDGIALYEWQPEWNALKRTVLSKQEGRFCHVVPAGTWQAAEPVGKYALVGCSVGPGFAFEDFALIEPESVEGKAILDLKPEMQRFVYPAQKH